ncbi:uncharacterized protein LOC126823574 [Patella vulgata]|uniref:uncharacterized protein LOC126823574 n=1 Tax=Patella vulgata TaxID=6465 RepID=UPI0024A8AE7A|nr:uncharacterized protein LOC126823574 [Patella vulgata]
MQSICDNISVDTDLPFVMTKIEQAQSVSKPVKPIDVEPGLGFVQNAGQDHLQNNTRNRNSKESPIGEKQKIVTGQIPQISSQTSLPQKNQVHVIQENDVLGKLAAALETIKLQNEIIEKLKQESGIASDIHVQTEEVVEETDLKAVAKTGEICTDEYQIVDIIPLIEQKGTMAPWDHSRIRSNMELLIEELDPDVLKTPLYSKYVLDIDNVDEIDVLPTRRKKNEKMLYMLMRRGNKAYKIFLKILETYGYRHVIKQLEPESEEYKGTIKYPGHELVEIMDYTSPKHKEFIEMIECDIELQYPESTEIVVVKKLTKGCVEVTFHLISVGKKSEHELRQILETAVNSGKIGDNKVSPEGFSFEKLTEDEEIPLPGSSIIDHENEIKSLKLQIKELQIENCALKATSVHSHEMEKYKEHEAKKYSDILKEKEQIISSLQEQLDQQKTDKEQLDQRKTDEKQLDQQKTDGKQLDQQKTDKEQLDQQKTDDKDTLEKEAGTDECQIIDSIPLIEQKKQWHH